MSQKNADISTGQCTAWCDHAVLPVVALAG
jgi:hypothetical protein